MAYCKPVSAFKAMVGNLASVGFKIRHVFPTFEARCRCFAVVFCRAEVACLSLLSPCVGFLCDVLIGVRLRLLCCYCHCCWSSHAGKMVSLLHAKSPLLPQSSLHVSSWKIRWGISWTENLDVMMSSHLNSQLRWICFILIFTYM